MMGNTLLTTSATPASSLCYLHNREDMSSCDFQQVSKLGLEWGGLTCVNSQSLIPPSLSPRGSVHHSAPQWAENQFPLSCLFEELLQLSPHGPCVSWNFVQLLFGNWVGNNSKGRSLTPADIAYNYIHVWKCRFPLAPFGEKKRQDRKKLFIKKSTSICLKTLHGKGHCFFGWVLVLNLFAVTFTVKSLPDYLHYLKKS